MCEHDQSFPKSVRLIRQVDFDLVHASQVYSADNTLVIKAIENGLPVSRLGLSISRKVGNAVIRNHWKRRIREAFRRQRHQLPLGLDLVVRPKKGARLDSAQIEISLQRLVVKIHNRIQKSSAKRNDREKGE